MKHLPDYEHHPIANIFPLMSQAEIDELAEDIKINGLTYPIVLYEGKILDGRNRYLACPKAGVTPEFWEYPGDTPIQFALTLNLHRRHLTIQQRAEIADKLATLPQGARTDLASNEARLSQRQAADAMGVSRSSVQRVRTERRRRANVESTAGSESPTDSNGDHNGEAPDADGASEGQFGEVDPEFIAERNKELLARRKCITQFKVFVRELSQQLHRPQKEIESFIKVHLTMVPPLI